MFLYQEVTPFQSAIGTWSEFITKRLFPIKAYTMVLAIGIGAFIILFWTNGTTVYAATQTDRIATVFYATNRGSFPSSSHDGRRFSYEPSSPAATSYGVADLAMPWEALATPFQFPFSTQFLSRAVPLNSEAKIVK